MLWVLLSVVVAYGGVATWRRIRRPTQILARTTCSLLGSPSTVIAADVAPEDSMAVRIHEAVHASQCRQLGGARYWWRNVFAGGKVALEAPAYCEATKARLRVGQSPVPTIDRMFDDMEAALADVADSAAVGAALRKSCGEISDTRGRALTSHDSITIGLQSPWRVADSAVLRLAPGAFPALPADVRRDLDRRGCLVPQLGPVFRTPHPHNVVSGAFTASGRHDWAVLCSVRRESQILVYREGESMAFDSLARGADETYLQTMGPSTIAFSHEISAASAADIRKHARDYGTSVPPALDHDGIDDGFMDKASQVYYFLNGKWLRLQGAD